MSQEATAPDPLPSRLALPSRGAMNIWFSGYAATVPAMAGSLISVLYYGAGLWAAASLLVRRYPLTVPDRARPFVLACLAYAVAMTFAGLVNPNLAELPSKLAPAAAFLFVPLLIARYHNADAAGSASAYCAFAPLGALAGLAIGLLQLRGAVEGGAGNPNVYAVVMADLGVFSLAGLFQEGAPRRKLVALVGYACATGGILLSDCRALYPMILLTPLLALALGFTHFSARRLLLYAAVILTIVGVALVVNKDRISRQLDAAMTDISLIQQDRFSTSFGLRVVLWEASVAAIADKPFLGYGPQNKMQAVYAHMDSRLDYIRFSHVHNALLDSMVAAGIPGLLAILAVLLTPLVTASRRGGRDAFLVWGHVAAFAMSGAFGALFTHDILTVTFLLPLIVLFAAPAPTGLRDAPQPARPER